MSLTRRGRDMDGAANAGDHRHLHPGALVETERLRASAATLPQSTTRILLAVTSHPRPVRRA